MIKIGLKKFTIKLFKVKSDLMSNMYEVRKYLRRYNAFIYTGDKHTDLDLIEAELTELKENFFIENDLYLKFILIIRKERRLLNNGN